MDAKVGWVRANVNSIVNRASVRIAGSSEHHDSCVNTKF
jgi:hypothetical protein